jgi:tetratricopeptide (TPR) repeat protein
MSLGPAGQGEDPDIESSLRTCIKLNPAFAPAYDTLARYYMRDPAKTNEAHLLNIRAIMLEPDNIAYRLNAALILANAQRYGDALAVLQAASRVAKTPEQVDSIQIRIGQIQEYQAAVARNKQAEKSDGTQTPATIVTDTRTMTITRADGSKFVLRPDSPQQTPRYPTEAPTGQHHIVRGVLRSVHCTYPAVLTLSVDRPGNAPAVDLYRNDFKQIEFSALNFAPKGDLNPCTDIEGLKAKVEYAEVSDKSIAGQIISVELSK